MVEYITDLDKVLVEDLQALAHDKTLVVASCKALAMTVAHDLEVPISVVVSLAIFFFLAQLKEHAPATLSLCKGLVQQCRIVLGAFSLSVKLGLRSAARTLWRRSPSSFATSWSGALSCVAVQLSRAAIRIARLLWSRRGWSLGGALSALVLLGQPLQKSSSVEREHVTLSALSRRSL